MNKADNDKENLILLGFKWILRKLGADALVQGILLLVLYACLIFGLNQMMPRLNFGELIRPVLVGLLLGWLLARSTIKGWISWVIAIIIGLFFLVISLSGASELILRLVSFAWKHTIEAIVFNPVRVDTGDATLVQDSLKFLEDVSVLFSRTVSWILRIVKRQSAFDSLAASFGWSMLLWIISVWGSWVLLRQSRPLLAVLPAGILLSVSLAFTGESPMLLVGVLISALMLLSWKGISQRLHFWEKQAIDYAEDLPMDTSLAALGLTFALAVFAYMASLVSLERIDNFLDRFRPTSGQTTIVGESLGLIQRKATPDPITRKALTRIDARGLPRSHLIGSGPELSREMVMTISTGDYPPVPVSSLGFQTFQAPRYYWRGLTFDIYNGLGWETSDTETITYSGKESAHPALDFFPPEGESVFISADYRREGVKYVHQQVSPLADLNGLAYTAGEALVFDQPYRIAWRIPPDPFSGPDGDLYTSLGRFKTYLAWSLLTRPSQEQLRQSSNTQEKQNFPQWIEQRYLSLPASLPQRVRDLANQLIQGHSTQYDQAKAIEAYLRSFPYTLDLPAPPRDRDVVDYFLFDLRSGYCDYYATAMVVLARAVGIPARLAIGYSSGNYDPVQAIYVVTEEDAHSWPEIYFSGLGWVEFEPTAGLPAIEHPTGAPPSGAVASLPTPLPGQTWTGINVTRYLTIGIAIVLALLLSWSLLDNWRINRMSPGRVIILLIQRLYRHASRLGVTHTSADTPLEFSNHFSEYLLHLQAGKGWKSRLLWITVEISSLIGLYNHSQYSPHPLKEQDRKRALNTWKKIDWRLWLLKGLRFKK